MSAPGNNNSNIPKRVNIEEGELLESARVEPQPQPQPQPQVIAPAAAGWPRENRTFFSRQRPPAQAVDAYNRFDSFGRPFQFDRGSDPLIPNRVMYDNLESNQQVERDPQYLAATRSFDRPIHDNRGYGLNPGGRGPHFQHQRPFAYGTYGNEFGGPRDPGGRFGAGMHRTGSFEYSRRDDRFWQEGHPGTWGSRSFEGGEVPRREFTNRPAVDPIHPAARPRDDATRFSREEESTVEQPPRREREFSRFEPVAAKAESRREGSPAKVDIQSNVTATSSSDPDRTVAEVADAPRVTEFMESPAPSLPNELKREVRPLIRLVRGGDNPSAETTAAPRLPPRQPFTVAPRLPELSVNDADDKHGPLALPASFRNRPVSFPPMLDDNNADVLETEGLLGAPELGSNAEKAAPLPRRKSSGWGQGVLSRVSAISTDTASEAPVEASASADFHEDSIELSTMDVDRITAVDVDEEHNYEHFPPDDIEDSTNEELGDMKVSPVSKAQHEPIEESTEINKSSNLVDTKSSLALGEETSANVQEDSARETSTVKRSVLQPKREKVDDASSEESEEQPRRKRGRPSAAMLEKANTARQLSFDKVPLSRQNSSASIGSAGRSKGRQANAGGGRGRGRRPNGKPLTSLELRRNRDRANLPFSSEKDISRAYNAIRYMVNITQGGSTPMYRFLKPEKPPKPIGKIPMPVTSEIAVCLDIIEAKSGFIWRQLVELKREEKVVMGVEADDDDGDAAQEDERVIIESITRGIVATALANAGYPSDAYVSPEPVVAPPLHTLILSQNTARIQESEVSLCTLDTRGRSWFEIPAMELIEKNAKLLLRQRASMTAAIRRKKINTRRAWELLGDKYLAAKHRYDAFLADAEEEDEVDAKQKAGRSVLTSRFSARLGSTGALRGDVVRSEYDSDRLLQQLMLKESLEVRVAKGKAEVPDMVTPWCGPDHNKPLVPVNPADAAEQPLPVFMGKLPDVVDLSGGRLTLDGKRQACSQAALQEPCPKGCNCAKQVEAESRRERGWTDVEKCIFIDKFLQFPKNFPKISSFLANRDTKDCIKFYYDSKARMQFKSLLREFDHRRRNQRNTWTFTVAAAESVGAGLYLTDDVSDREAILELPLDDLSYRSNLMHPPFLQQVFKGLSERGSKPVLDRPFAEIRQRPYVKKSLEVEAQPATANSDEWGIDSRPKAYKGDSLVAAYRHKNIGGRPGRGRGRGRWSRSYRGRDNAHGDDDKSEEDKADDETAKSDDEDGDAAAATEVQLVMESILCSLDIEDNIDETTAALEANAVNTKRTYTDVGDAFSAVQDAKKGRFDFITVKHHPSI